eukprot:TRINITY_DN50196_c0_g1_i1.p1 TRINITY_DN50196_c0_g1~~TRINITY_DN50196_c0_g1_i1.p1  ORF type:complete len:411 (+),score=86.33 TRINITY_DN50196_c0_g1_i1:74-1306(+)
MASNRRWLRLAARSASTVGKAHFAGLRGGRGGGRVAANLTTELKSVWPDRDYAVLQLLGGDGTLRDPSGQLPCSEEDGAAMLRSMLRAREMDRCLQKLQDDGKLRGYTPTWGEEASSVAIAAALAKDDALWPEHNNELGVLLHRGCQVQQIVDHCLGKRQDDPGRAWQTPLCSRSEALQLQAPTARRATSACAVLQAAGAGYVMRSAGESRCSVAIFSAEATAEAEFAVGLNFAATTKGQVLVICRSRPWRRMGGGDASGQVNGVAPHGPAYGTHTQRVDGADALAVYLACSRAREHCVEEGEPAFLELLMPAQGDEANRCDGIQRLRQFLKSRGQWSESEEEEIVSQARREVAEAISLASERKPAAVLDIFKHTWAEPPPRQARQREELESHINRHKEHYIEATRSKMS